MPTYEYECEACRHAFEEFQSMSAAPLKTCPACKKRKLVRLIGAGAGIIFKGSGFYETDYKRKAGGGDKEKGGEPKSEPKSEAKTESKKDSPASAPAVKESAAKPASSGKA